MGLKTRLPWRRRQPAERQNRPGQPAAPSRSLVAAAVAGLAGSASAWFWAGSRTRSPRAKAPRRAEPHGPRRTNRWRGSAGRPHKRPAPATGRTDPPAGSRHTPRRRPRTVPARYRRDRAYEPTNGAAAGDGTGVARSWLFSPNIMQEEIKRAVGLVLIDGVGWVDLFWTDLGADANRGAGPYPVFPVDPVQPELLSAIARVTIISLQHGHCARADEIGIGSELWTGGVAQHAIDAVAEGFIRSHLRGCLQIGAVLDRLRHLWHEVDR